MRRLFVLLAIVSAIISIVTPAIAAPVQSANSAFALGIKSARSQNITVTLPDYELTQESVNGTLYQKIQLPDAGYALDAGSPELPFISTMVAIPRHGQVRIEVLNSHQKILEHFLPYPAQNDDYAGSGRGFALNQAIYQSGQTFPRDTVLCSDPQILRDFRVVNLQVQPFVWDSLTHQLTVTDRMEIRLTYTAEPGINEIDEPLQISAAFDNIYQSMILNYADFRPEQRLIAQTPPRIVIVHGNYNNAIFIQKINEFALWKRQKGADVRVVSTATTGANTTVIKAYLQGLYDDVNTRPDFVILIGDTNAWFPVPTYTVAGMDGDYPYQMLAGNDQLGDCFIGRMSAENLSQLEVLFAKVYAYEKTLNMATADYLNRTLLVADTIHDGISVVYLRNYLRELILTFNPEAVFPTPMDGGMTVSFMNTAISQGVNFFIYRGYIGMSGWSPSPAQTNINKLCHTVAITCATGNFNNGTATLESFTRQGTVAAPTGAITGIGDMSASGHTMPNNCLTGAIADGIYARGMRTMGEALLHSKLYLDKMYHASYQEMVTSFTQRVNLFGDPSVEVYVTVPHTFAINVPDTLVAGTLGLGLTVRAEDSSVVANACVTLSQGSQILGRAYSDEQGFAYLDFSAGLADTTTVITVSKHDFMAWQQVCSIDGSGYLVAGAAQYDDDAEGNSNGNGNLAPNSGERLEVRFAVTNTTDRPIRNVTGYVTGDDPHITVLDSLLAFGSIEPGVTVLSTLPAVLDIADNTPSFSYLRLQLHLTDQLHNAYLVPTAILSTDAVLSYVTHQVADTNNQLLDPGETAVLTVTIANRGSIGISNITGHLYALNDMVSIVDATASFGSIEVNGQWTCTADPFQISGSDHILAGMLIPLRLKLTTPAGFLKWIDFSLPVGTAAVSSPSGPDAYGYVIYDDGDTAYPECPAYAWVGIAPAEGGSGTALDISDVESNGEGDALGAVSLATVTLPFTFRFYGQDYTQVTVCSNGFLAMGVTQDASFRNYHLPGAIGPGAMIAAFWDDLATAAGSGIYTWSDPANHRYIVEWYQLHNGYVSTALETFQVILYDPAFYPTSRGDGPIKIQYFTFNNVDSYTGYQNSGCYSTIGIQDQYHQSGLEYSFNNTYLPSASPLADGRCIYITDAPAFSSLPIMSVGLMQITDTNVNGVPEAGETIGLSIPLSNSGAGDMAAAVGTLSASDPYVTLINAQSVYPAIPAAGSGINQTPFTLFISPACPDSHIVALGLDIAAAGYTDHYTITFTVSEPLSAQDNQPQPIVNALYSNFPNPFNLVTTLSYSIKDRSPVRIDIYNAKGQLIRTLIHTTKASGSYTEVWNGRDSHGKAVASGVYTYRMQAGNYTATRRMLLLK